MLAHAGIVESGINIDREERDQHADREQSGHATAGMTFLSNWVPSVFPELQRVPGTKLDQRRSTWILLHGGLRRVRRARLLVDYLSAALLERRAEFIGQ